MKFLWLCTNLHKLAISLALDKPVHVGIVHVIPHTLHRRRLRQDINRHESANHFNHSLIYHSLKHEAKCPLNTVDCIKHRATDNQVCHPSQVYRPYATMLSAPQLTCVFNSSA